MVVLVAEQAKRANIGDVFIACCGKEIAHVIKDYGFRYIITDPLLQSGTDRVFHAIKLLEKNNNNQYDFIINVQGDMPFIKPDIIKKTLYALQMDNTGDIATPITNIFNDEEMQDPNVVKAIVSDANKHALYFTRSPVISSYKHLGVYAYRKNSLQKFVDLPPSILEKAERLEQLRALENGMKIITTLVADDTISVDTEKDLDRARKFLGSS